MNFITKSTPIIKHVSPLNGFLLQYWKHFDSHRQKLMLLSPSPLTRITISKPIISFPPSLRVQLLNYCASPDAGVLYEALETDSVSEPDHPWSEWVSFVDHLKSKGYLAKTRSSSSQKHDSESIYKDMSSLKDACLSFGRDRFDIFESLSQDDIRAIVERGCPNHLRKVVNSAKRLRAYANLDEAHVCSTCSLRESCDRAYVVLKDSEAVARTVDVVRILLFYALDPLVISEEVTQPVREQAELAATRLISGLTELSEVSKDPALPEPAVGASFRKAKIVNFVHDRLSENEDKKTKDWTCPECNFLNFARNTRCLKCKENAPLKVRIGEGEMKKGDWICSKCNFLNFARNTRCRNKCKEDGPLKAHSYEGEMKKGDWICSKCNFLNFARNTRCFKCKEDGPLKAHNDLGDLKKGDWICSECEFVNFSRNIKCRRCKAGDPRVAV